MTRRNFQANKPTKLIDFFNELALAYSFNEPSFHILNGHVFVDGKRCRQLDSKLKKGSRIVLHDVSEHRKPNIRYLVQNEYFLVVDKAAGDHVNQTETTPNYSVIEAVQEQFEDAKLVHRLDKETSGVLLIGRGARNTRILSQCFENRRVKKTYVALVEGEIDERLTLDSPLSKDPRNPRNFRVHKNGKNSQTKIVRLQNSKEFSVVNAFPITGRTHQIRVHLADAGYPILGDRQYGGPTAVRVEGEVRLVERVMLHARALQIPATDVPWSSLQESDNIEFFAPLPADMEKYGCEELAQPTAFQ